MMLLNRTRSLALACAIASFATPPRTAIATDAATGDHSHGAAAPHTHEQGGDAMHEHGHDDDAKPHGPGHGATRAVPDTVPGIWTAIDADVARLETTIQKGELSSVHGIAFGIRDLVRALPTKSGTLPEPKQKLLAGFVTRVDEHAANLDRYGDAGNAAATVNELGELKKRLQHIRSLYPEVPIAAEQHSDASPVDVPEATRVTGEVVDARCYEKRGAEATGSGHRDCAIQCIKEHDTAAVRDESDGKLYRLAYSADTQKQRVLESVASRARVSGHLIERDGREYLEMDSLRREHDHAEAPHGGVIGMSGGRHVEVVTDRQGAIRVYLLDEFMDSMDVSHVTGTASIRSKDEKERSSPVTVRGEFLAVNDTMRAGADEELTLELDVGEEPLSMTLPLPSGEPTSD